jgi:hypothetical protein
MVKLIISPTRTAKVLAITVSCITVISILIKFLAYYSGDDSLFGLVRQFDLNGEANIPSWYQATSLLLCSILLAAIASTKKADGDSYARHWIALSIIFLYLAIDEAAQLHEMLTVPLRSAFHPSGFFYYVWVIPLGAFVLIFVLAYLRFLAHLPAKTRLLFIIAGAIYVGGALGMEMVAGYLRSLYGIPKVGPLYAMLVII